MTSNIKKVGGTPKSGGREHQGLIREMNVGNDIYTEHAVHAEHISKQGPTTKNITEFSNRKEASHDEDADYMCEKQFIQLEVNTDFDHTTTCDSSVKLGCTSTSHGERIIPSYFPKLLDKFKTNLPSGSVVTSQFNAHMIGIYNKVFSTTRYNHPMAHIPIPSGLHMDAWKIYLEDYSDGGIVKFLEYGWPSNFNHASPLLSTFRNHKSGMDFSSHIGTYLKTEMDKFAILGPFSVPPVVPLHLSPIMTRPKKGSELRRVVVDLLWPHSLSINDGIPANEYVGEPVSLRMPTVDYMADRMRDLGPNCYMYKLDLSRGYRQLRLDPLDWPLMSIGHAGFYYMDVYQPFGLRTAALMMERTTMAVSYIHGLYGYKTKPYIDDFGGVELEFGEASDGLLTLQHILNTVGLEEAPHKTCFPSTEMVWLGITVKTADMTLSIPLEKLREVQAVVRSWDSRLIATRRQVQLLMGLLTFVASVAPPVRVYTNRILNSLCSMPKDGYVTVTNGIRKDLGFSWQLMPKFNGITLMGKSLVPPDEQLELDSCLTGCGGLCGQYYYSCAYPLSVLSAAHPIAHLEMRNVVVALRLWAPLWEGKKLQIYCDNMNTCVALQTGRSRDTFMQVCVRSVFVLSVGHDIEILVCHRLGVSLVAADS